MVVKARDDVTVATLNDVAMVLPYYLTQSNTASTPATPTTNPPTGNWTNAEPTYNSSNTVYMSFLTVFSDGSFDWSTPSKSSNYEAAKAAYNKATSAYDTAGEAKTTADQAIFSTLPSLADPTKANSWFCAIFPTGTSSVQPLPSYSLIAPLAASYTKYQDDGTSGILRGDGIDYSYGLIRTLVSFNADMTWTFTYCHDDGSRIYVDGVNVFERAQYTIDDPVTISFAKGNHIVDVMYSNGTGGAGIWGFSVALSSIVTTMYAPAGTSVLSSALDTTNKNVTTALSQLTSINGLVGGLRTDVDTVSNKATTLASGLDSANTNITTTSDKLAGLTTTVSNVSKTADDAMALSTTNHQDLAGFKTTVQQTYSTKEDTLSQVSAVSQKADAISATLSKDYQKTADSDAKYSTKAELTATSNSITASVAETYATKSVVDALKNIADNAIETWQGHGVPSMTGEPASEWTTGELKKQHSGDMYYDLDTGYSYRFGSADGSTYTWDKISDSDITRAMQAAADAHIAADKANAGVSKLNTDIPVTYATKSDVKITTDGIKTDVSKAMTLGQTGIDNAATVDQKADGIQATVTQQAQNISDNVKAIAQVNMRADSLSTSISQVSTKTDLALANAANYVKNPQFHGSNLDSVRTTQMDASDPNAGTLPAGALTYGKNTGGYDCIADAVRIRAIAGHTYRIEIDSKPASDMPSTETEPFGLMYWCMTADNPGITANQHIWGNTTATTVTDWTHSKMEFTYAGTEPWSVFRPAYRAKSTQRWLVTNFSCTDVTEVVAARSTADTALSQTSTLSQDLSGFKTEVTQTYETKEASASKATTAQQNLDGFKNTVQNDYLSKTDAGTTYSTKTETAQTATQIKTEVASIYATQDTVSQVSSTVTQNTTDWSVNLNDVTTRLDGVDTTTSDLSDQLSTANDNIQSVNDALSDEIGNRQAYMRFSQDADGKPLLELGDSASKVKAQLRNDRLSFVSGDVEVAYVSDNQLYINTATVKNMLRIGNFMWAPRSDGHVTLSRI